MNPWVSLPRDPSQALPADAALRGGFAVPGERVRLLWLDLPMPHLAQAQAAAKLRVQEHLGLADAQVHVAVAGHADADGKRLVAVVDEACMREWRQRLQAQDIHPQALVPDCLLLPQAQDDSVNVWAHDGLWSVRGARLAFTAEETLARHILGERALHFIDADALQAGTDTLDLLQGTHATRRDAMAPHRGRRIALLATLLLFSPLLILAAQWLRHSLSARWLEHRSDALAALAIAHVPGSGPASQRLHGYYRELTAADRLAQQSAALFDALEALPGAQLDSQESSPETGLRVGLVHAGPADIERLRTQMAAVHLDVIVLDEHAVAGGLRSLLHVETMP